jgi:hypothetical protein
MSGVYTSETAGAPGGSGPDASQEVLRFWRHLFGGERGLLQIWTAHRDEAGRLSQDSIKSNFFNYPKAAETAARWALQMSAEGRETYFCTHLLTAPRRIKEYAAAVRALWGELDGAQLPDGEHRPSAVVESSPGRYHVYVRLTDAIPPQDAERLNKKLAACYGGDASGHDLSQLLRVPGTVNHKYAEKPLVKVIRLDAEHFYEPGVLERTLPEIEDDLGDSGPEDGHEGLAQDEPPVRLGEAAMRWWRGEAPVLMDDGTVDRSKTLRTIAFALARAGASARTVAEALRERDESLGFHKASRRRDGGKCRSLARRVDHDEPRVRAGD